MTNDCGAKIDFAQIDERCFASDDDDDDRRIVCDLAGGKTNPGSTINI